MNREERLKEMAEIRAASEIKLKRVSYKYLQGLSGHDAERLCDALGLGTQGWDEQLRMRLAFHKKKLAGKL